MSSPVWDSAPVPFLGAARRRPARALGRRDFGKYLAGAGALSLGVLARPREADAFLPVIARLLFGRAIKRQVKKAVTKKLAAKRRGEFMKGLGTAVAVEGAILGGYALLAPQAHAAAVEPLPDLGTGYARAGAGAVPIPDVAPPRSPSGIVWFQDETRTLTVAVSNHNGARVASSLTLSLLDLRTGSSTPFLTVPFTVNPRTTFSVDVELSAPSLQGRYRIVGRSGDSRVEVAPSPAFTVRAPHRT